jgi:hypothetical protein
MESLKSILILLLIFIINTKGSSQIIQRSGYIYTAMTSKISVMPSDSGNHYTEPTPLQLNTWETTLNNLLVGNYSIASDSANSIGYNLVNFTDTFALPHVTYYILETVDSNYWGTYVYNPNYCRPLVIQSPHAKKDANTGHQGVHVFRKTEALFYQVSGTHRCNSSIYSSCTGTTKSCSNTSTSEPYPISDLAHNTLSIFQKTTEVLFNSFANTYFIQLHGFTKQSTDPYVILSNGTQQTPVLDYLSDFKNNLFNEDSVLTFKIAHIDLSWTRLRGFWNTQGRLINGSSNPCDSSATLTSGRFFHIEQERSRLRSSVSGWNKIQNALRTTFTCTPLSTKEVLTPKQPKVYPNPVFQSTTIEWAEKEGINEANLIYNFQGQNLSKQISVLYKETNKVTISLGKLPRGYYIIRLNNSILKIYKN